MFSTIPVIKPVEYTNTHQRIIERHDIHLFCVKTNPDEIQPLPLSSLPLKEEKVYLLVNQALRKIFLWVGLAAPARSRFVGVHSANVIQREIGITYRVENVDQQSKSTDFLQTLATFEA